MSYRLRSPGHLLRVALPLVGVLCLSLVPLVLTMGGPPEVETRAVEAPPALPRAVLAAALEPVQEELERRAFPGAAVALGSRDREVHLHGLGAIGWTENAAPVDPVGTVYDLASLTKVVATASAAMLLVDDGRIRLDDPVAKHLPEFSGGAKDRVTIRHLLTHTSGLPAGARLRGDSRREVVERLIRLPVNMPPGKHAAYSDVGYVILWEALQRAAGEPLPRYLERRLYRPLGMTRTRFLPGLECEECAPTGRLRDQSLFRGKPFDPTAQKLDGISGNAGLFSTAHDVARFAAMITAGGELDGVRVLREETVREFTSPQPSVGGRMLGWEVLCREGAESSGGRCEEPIAFGHTGWTGTSLWIDPQRGAWTVLLTNRTYEPRASNRIQRVRREVFQRLAGIAPRDASYAAAPPASPAPAHRPAAPPPPAPASGGAGR